MAINLPTLLNNFRELSIVITTYKISDGSQDKVIDGYIIDGSLSIDGQSSVRRSFSATIVLDHNNSSIEEIKNSLNPYSVGGGLEKKIKIEIKVRNPGGAFETEDFGYFILTEISFSKSIDSYIMSISAQDLMIFLNGDVGGAIGKEYQLDLTNTSYKKVLTSIMENYAKNIYQDLNIVLASFAERLGRLTTKLPKGEIFLKQVGTGRYSSFSSTGAPYEKTGETIDVTERIADSDVGKVYSLTVPLNAGNGEDTSVLAIGPTDNISSVIDKIVQSIEQNYEYYFSPNGSFNFKLKEEFKTEKDTLPEDFSNSLFVSGEKYLPSFSSLSSSFDFNSYNGNDISIVSSYGNNPMVRGIKNEFYVNGKDGVLYHLVIGDKPTVDTYFFGRGIKVPSLEYRWHIIKVLSRSLLGDTVTVGYGTFENSPFVVGDKIKFNSSTGTLSNQYQVASISSSSFTYTRPSGDTYLPSVDDIILVNYNTMNHWQQYIIDVYEAVEEIGKTLITNSSLNSSIKNKILADFNKYGTYYEELKKYFLYDGNNDGIFQPNKNRRGAPYWRVVANKDNSIQASLTAGSNSAIIFGGKNINNLLKEGVEVGCENAFMGVLEHEVQSISKKSILLTSSNIKKIILSSDKTSFSIELSSGIEKIASICDNEYVKITYSDNTSKAFKVLSSNSKTKKITLQNPGSSNVITDKTKILKIEQTYLSCLVNKKDPLIESGHKVYIYGKNNSISTEILDATSSQKEIRFSDRDKGVDLVLPAPKERKVGNKIQSYYTIKVSSDETRVVKISTTVSAGYFKVIFSNKARVSGIKTLSFQRSLFEHSQDEFFRGALTSWKYYFDIICPSGLEKYKIETIGRRAIALDKDENITSLYPTFFGNPPDSQTRILIFPDSSRTTPSIDISQCSVTRLDKNCTISVLGTVATATIASGGTHEFSIGSKITIWKTGVSGKYYQITGTTATTFTFSVPLGETFSGTFKATQISVIAKLQSTLPENVSSGDYVKIQGINPSSKFLTSSHRIESVSYSDKEIQFFIKNPDSGAVLVGESIIPNSIEIPPIEKVQKYSKAVTRQVDRKKSFVGFALEKVSVQTLKEGMFIQITAKKPRSPNVVKIVRVSTSSFDKRLKKETFRIKDISSQQEITFSGYTGFSISPCYIPISSSTKDSSKFVGSYLSDNPSFEKSTKIIKIYKNYLCLSSPIIKDIEKGAKISISNFSACSIINSAEFYDDNAELFAIRNELDVSGTPYISILESQARSYFNTDEFRLSNDAFSTLKSLLYKQTTFNETISLEAVPMYNLDVNTVVTVSDSDTQISDKYFINNITIPLSPEGTMSITATKIY